MNLLIISDTTFDPIVNEIYKQSPLFNIEFIYLEDINLFFFNDKTYNFDSIFFHSDLYFHKKDINWQKEFLININLFCNENQLKLVTSSNTFNLTYNFKGLNTYFSETENQNIELQYEIQQLNNLSNFYFFDFKKIVFNYGLINSYNYSLGAMYQMPYKKPLIIEFSKQIVDFFNFLCSEEKKAIVVDCDNTLWNGILGEDGSNGIVCNKNYDGLVFYNFQLFLKERLNDGFILCICSKNNEIEVESLFKMNKFPLKWDDFLIKKINWIDKSINIKEIAQELNIGENSLIFIDDNPFELDSVLNLTSIEKAFLFKNNFDNLSLITNDYCFKKKRILKDDIDKNQSYKIEQIRKQELNKFNDLDEYIESLNLILDVFENDKLNLERASQMTEKTNQFNFNKKYYSINELEDWIYKGNLLFTANLSDKYGEYGIIGLILIGKIDQQTYYIENYLISCRALGKKIEEKFLKEIECLLKSKNKNITTINFRKTEKNKPAELFINKIKKNGYNIREIK